MTTGLHPVVASRARLALLLRPKRLALPSGEGPPSRAGFITFAIAVFAIPYLEILQVGAERLANHSGAVHFRPAGRFFGGAQ